MMELEHKKICWRVGEQDGVAPQSFKVNLGAQDGSPHMPSAIGQPCHGSGLVIHHHLQEGCRNIVREAEVSDSCLAFGQMFLHCCIEDHCCLHVRAQILPHQLFLAIQLAWLIANVFFAILRVSKPEIFENVAEKQPEMQGQPQGASHWLSLTIWQDHRH